MSSLELSFRLD